MTTDSFSPEELEAIRGAVREAELETSAEIVPLVAEASDAYAAAPLVGAVSGALLGLFVYSITFVLWPAMQRWQSEALGWTEPSLDAAFSTEFVLVGLGALLGWLFPRFIPAARRLLTPNTFMDDMVHRRAMQAFLEEEVFLTRDRTGILIYISLQEHRVEILGDSGINAAVDPAEWASISDDLCRAIRAKDVVGGLINTIRRCGELLSAKGLAIKADDTNELGNGLRTRGFDWV